MAELGDPFFNLVLRNHADVVSLAEIEDLIQPDRSKRDLFVVDEHIVESSRPSSAAPSPPTAAPTTA